MKEGAGSKRIPGLLFADDAVILADGKEELRRSIGLVEQWTHRWEMEVNVSKCGIIRFSNRDTERNKRVCRNNTPITIGGEVVPEVDSYVYLGITLDSGLSKNPMVARNASKGRGMIGSLRGFLSEPRYPVYLKKLLLKAKLLPILTYGAELWGMNTQLCTGAQRVMDSACRMTMGVGKTTCLHRMRAELGMPTISQVATEKRTRAWGKYPSLRTWISLLVQSKGTGRKDTWVTGTSRWLKTYLKDGEGERNGKRILIEKVYATRESRRDKSQVSTWAMNLGLKHSSWISAGVDYPELARELLLVGRICMGAIPRIWRKGEHRGPSRAACRFCSMKTPDSLEHIVLECPRYEVARGELIKPLFPSWEAMYESPIARKGAMSVLLGGELGPEVKNGSEPREAPTSNERTGAKEKGSATNGMTKPSTVVSTARFLAHVGPRRSNGGGTQPKANERKSSWNQGPRGMVALGEL